MPAPAVVVALVAVTVIGGILLAGKSAEAAALFTCPYGDGLQFNTLAALNDHISLVHPGEPIFLNITLE